MTLLAALAIVAILALVAVIVLLMRSHREAQAGWTAERRELLNRIQAPDRIVVSQDRPFELPDEEPDESNLVGTIAPLADDYGQED